MADTSAPGLLSAGVVSDVITIEDTFPGGLTIAKIPNADGSITPHPIWYRLDGVDPSPMGAGSHVCFDVVVLPNQSAAGGARPTQRGEKVQVKLVCEAACRYTVEGAAPWKIT